MNLLTMETEEQIRQLHQTYCEQTGLEIICNMGRRYFWEVFLQRGFTMDDLILVCRNLRRQVKDGRRNMGCLFFTRLLGDLDVFEEFLAEFRALQRKPRFPIGKAQVLNDTRRKAEPATSPPRKARDVLKGLQIADQLRQFRNKL